MQPLILEPADLVWQDELRNYTGITESPANKDPKESPANEDHNGTDFQKTAAKGLPKKTRYSWLQMHVHTGFGTAINFTETPKTATLLLRRSFLIFPFFRLSSPVLVEPPAPYTCALWGRPNSRNSGPISTKVAPLCSARCADSKHVLYFFEAPWMAELAVTLSQLGVPGGAVSPT